MNVATTVIVSYQLSSLGCNVWAASSPRELPHSGHRPFLLPGSPTTTHCLSTLTGLPDHSRPPITQSSGLESCPARPSGSGPSPSSLTCWNPCLSKIHRLCLKTLGHVTSPKAPSCLFCFPPQLGSFNRLVSILSTFST